MGLSSKLSFILPTDALRSRHEIAATDWYIRAYHPVHCIQGVQSDARLKRNIIGYEQVETESEISESGYLYPETCTAITFYCGPSKPYAYVSGIFTQPVVFSDLKPGIYFTVIFAPTQMHAFLRMPLFELSNQWAEVKKLPDFNLSLVLEKIAGASSFCARVAIWESFYMKWLLSHSDTMVPVIKQILDWSAVNSYSIDERALSKFAGYTDRHLRNLFYTYLGVSFKTFQRILRYKRALWALSNATTPLTKIAYDTGYCDQAHFIREFRRFQGSTPSLFLKKYKMCAAHYQADL